MKVFNIITTVIMIVFYSLGIFFDIMYLKTDNYSFHIYYIISYIIGWIGTLCSLIMQIKKYIEQKPNNTDQLSTD